MGQDLLLIVASSLTIGLAAGVVMHRADFCIMASFRAMGGALFATGRLVPVVDHDLGSGLKQNRHEADGDTSCGVSGASGPPTLSASNARLARS